MAITERERLLAPSQLVVRVLSGALLFLLPLSAAAQVNLGSIAGTVRDTTGGVLPGVMVQASSPALIEGSREAVSDAQGNYRIPELRPGVYTVLFTLPGFATVRREGLELTSGFTATVNAELRVGSIEETVTVAGASPVIDVQNVRTQNVFSRELLDTLPTQRSIAGFATLTMGARLNNPALQGVGGSQSEAFSGAGFTVHGGRFDDQKLLQDGMPSTDASFSGNTNRNAVNAVAAQETVFQVGGYGAEAETGGVQINVIPKEGGNAFSYYLNANASNSSMQFENLSQELEDRGLLSAQSVKKIWDIGGAVGGPLRQDKLWFFASSRNWGSQNYVPNLYFNATHGTYLGAPDSGVQLYTPDFSRPAYTNGFLREFFVTRITWQATDKQKFNFSQNLQSGCECFRNVENGVTTPEAAIKRIYAPAWVSQGSWNYPRTSRLMFEGGMTWVMYLADSSRIEGVQPTDVAMIELQGYDLPGYKVPANMAWGAAVSASAGYARPYKLFSQINQRFVTSYITGSHTFKVGLTTMEGWNRDRTEVNDPPIRIRLRGGVADSIDEYTELENNQRLKVNLGLFVQDQWTVDRLTLNLGLRYNYFDAFVPSQTIRAPGNRDSLFLAPELGPDGIVFDRVDHVPYWKNWTPRLGASYDVFGNGKTAVKAALGKYVAYEGLTGIPRLNAPGRRLATTARRTWADADGDWKPDCDLANPLANGECEQVNDLNIGKLVPSTEYAPDVLIDGRGFNWQTSVSVSQELRPGLALNVGYFRTWYGNLTVQTNQALSAADFDPYCVTVPVDDRLGATSGQQICGLYDVKPPPVFGRVNNVITQASNFGDSTEVFDGVDIDVRGRYGRGGIVQGGVSFGRTVIDNCDVLNGNPQIASNPYILGGDPTAFCRQVDGNQTAFKAAGNYPLPWWGLETSATYQNNPGVTVSASRVYTRAEVRSTMGTLGRNLNASNVTIPIMIPFTEDGDRISQLDFRFGKRFELGRGRLRAQFDIYNVFNTAAVTGQNNTYGDTWQNVQAILGGRLLKFGGQFEF